ncbi:MAG: hypothetical protein OXI88_16530 [Gammaproteobacteria bacterium]|nr:hypothetical protein [Gammaproteobacteria bacterium]
MAAARKEDSDDKVFKIYQLGKSDNGNLICEFCPAEIQYVSAHTGGASDIYAYERFLHELLSLPVRGTGSQLQDGRLEDQVHQRTALGFDRSVMVSSRPWIC